MRKVLATVAVAAAGLALATAATAATPEDSPAPVVQGSFDITNEFVGDTTLCGFPVDLTVHSTGTFRFFPTEQGHSFTNATTGIIEFTVSANGKTVSARVVLQETFFPSPFFPEYVDVLTMHGISIQIRLLGGGIVIQDAGLVVELPDGSTPIVRGPHPVLMAGGLSAGVAQICALLAP